MKGRLVINLGKILLFMILLVSVVSARDSFNLEIDLPKAYQEVIIGERILFTTEVVNLVSKERMDVILRHEILDFNKQLKFSKLKTVAVETQASFVESIKIPKNLEEGFYFLRVILISRFGETEAEVSFEITKPSSLLILIRENLLYSIIILTNICLLILIILIFYKLSKLLKKNRIVVIKH